MSQLDDGCSTSMANNKEQRSLLVSPGSSRLEAGRRKQSDRRLASRPMGPVAVETTIPCQPRPPKCQNWELSRPIQRPSSDHLTVYQQVRKLVSPTVCMYAAARKKKNWGEKESATVTSEGKQKECGSVDPSHTMQKLVVFTAQHEEMCQIRSALMSVNQSSSAVSRVFRSCEDSAGRLFFL